MIYHAPRQSLIWRLSRQMERLRQDLRRVSSETLLLAAMEAARPLTPGERTRANHLRLEMSRIERDLIRLHSGFSRLDERAGPPDVHQDVHRPRGARGPGPALTDEGRAP